MEKNTVFFSHTSKDREAVLFIQKRIKEITGNSINIFMSSDGQSIPFGTNWVHKVEEGLSLATIMFVFVTPASIKSGWIYFEAGFAYSKGIEVIPVGINTDIGNLRAPLSLLQGFNIASADSLNNFISVINKKYGCTFEESFTDEDFQKILSLNDDESAQQFQVESIASFADFHIISEYKKSDGTTKEFDLAKIYKRIIESLESEGVQYAKAHNHYSSDTSQEIITNGIRIACGVLMGFVFSCYKDGLFSWTDNAQGAHALDGSNLKTMVYNLVKGKMTTDYLSSGSKTFQVFREYVKSIMNLADGQVAIETECWHNMREAVTAKGAPFWTLKYLPDNTYGSEDLKEAAMKIVDQIQLYIQQDTDHENIMSNVLQLFTKRGKIKQALGNAFQDKNVMNAAFRSFLFKSSPDLKQIADGLSIQPQELMDKIHAVMQGAIYTWTEEQVKEKLEDVIGDYRYLQAVNGAVGKKYHAIDEAKRDLANLFKYERISLAAVESLDKPWYPALMILYNISKGIYTQAAGNERANEIEQLNSHGKEVMDFLQDWFKFLNQ